MCACKLACLRFLRGVRNLIKGDRSSGWMCDISCTCTSELSGAQPAVEGTHVMLRAAISAPLKYEQGSRGMHMGRVCLLLRNGSQQS